MRLGPQPIRLKRPIRRHQPDDAPPWTSTELRHPFMNFISVPAGASPPPKMGFPNSGHIESFEVIWDQSGMNWCGATISHHMSTKSPPQVINDSSDSVKQLFWLEISGVNIWTAKFALWLKKKLDSKTCLWFKNNFFPFIKFNSFPYQLQMIFCEMLLKCWWFFLRIYSRKSETFNFSRFFGLQYLNLATRGHRCSSVGLMGFPIFQEVQHFRVLSSLK